MAIIGSYNTRAFSEGQKFLVLDPATGATSLVLGEDLVNYLTPSLNSVKTETTRLAAETVDYPVGTFVQTAGRDTIGDPFAGTYLVVAAGEGDVPMLNGNELLLVKGDDLLRELLASALTGDGSDLVAHTGTSDTVTEALNNRVIRVSSRTEMKAYDVPAGYQFSLEEGGRSGIFVVKSGTPPSDPQEGIYVLLDNGNYAERIWKGSALVDWFGASPSISDNTSAYDGAIQVLPELTTVKWGKSGEVYAGQFNSESKCFVCDVNDATLTNTVDNLPIISQGSLTNASEYAVVESTLNYLEKVFNVSGASTLFSVGDIGHLWDSAVRPTGGEVNFEAVKIKSISGDQITIEGFIASHKGAGAIKFYHDANQPKNGKIKNAHIAPSNTHNFIVSGFFGCEGVAFENVSCTNFVGNAFAARYCYDVVFKHMRPEAPRLTGSGQGYGVAVLGCSNIFVRDIKGIGCRHAYDQDSAYFVNIKGVSDKRAVAAPVDLAHNGFAGQITCKDIQVFTSSYPVVFDSQGYGGTPGAVATNHPFRKITIDSVFADVDQAFSVDDFGVWGVYLQNNVEDLEVKNISTTLHNGASPTVASASYCIRVNGDMLGYCSFGNISANRIGRMFAFLDNGVADPKGSAVIRNINNEKCRTVVLAQGGRSIDIDGVSLTNPPLETAVQMQSLGAETPKALIVGSNIGITTPLYQIASSTKANMFGEFTQRGDSSGASISIVAGGTLSATDIQWRSKFLQLLPPVGAGTIALGADPFPAPLCIGDTVEIFIPSGYNSIDVPSGTYNSAMTLSPGLLHKIVARAGSWQLYSY